MTVKNPKMTLKSLQIELNVLREELKLNRKELVDVKEELKNVKDEMKKETTEDPQVLEQKQNKDNPEKADNVKKDTSENSKKCKVCDELFSSRRFLKKHLIEKHPSRIKCNVCETSFDKNSDLEVHIKMCHESIAQHPCDLCGKTFVMKWRLNKHIEAHRNKSQKHCHYFNNDKSCPFEEIGCKFRHQNSDKCIFGEKCKNKLCQFKHKNVNDDDTKVVDDQTELTGMEIKEPVEMTEDEQHFDLYVDNCFPEVYEKYISGKRHIKCYFCDYVSKCEIIRNIQGELTNHLETIHSDIIEAYDPDNNEFDNDYHEEFLDFFTQ